MTKEEWDKTDFLQLCRIAKLKDYNVTNYEDLKDYAIEMIEKEKLDLAIHILFYLDNYPTNYYFYDYSMETRDIPTPIEDKFDLKFLIGTEKGGLEF